MTRIVINPDRLEQAKLNHEEVKAILRTDKDPTCIMCDEMGEYCGC